MTILIANIGTSDLAVNVDEYYFPVGFNRTEPNIDYSGLTSDEDAAWKEAKIFIEQVVGVELGLDKFSFREFTHKLSEAYREDEEKWHALIRPGRIWGAIVEAMERFQVKTAYIFITNQPHESDSVYLFDILQQWFKRELGDKIELKPVLIPAGVPAIDQDALLNEYYKFFLTLNKDEKILISTKGGTYQMQTALRVQAMSSDIDSQIFIDPILSIKKILAGEPSTCKQISYWRYLRTQKYQTVKQLLSRWDFDGATEILNKWLLSLTDLLASGVEDISDSKKVMESLIKTLDMAGCYFNLDSVGAGEIISSDSNLDSFREIQNEYDQLLNLYTQCRIYWELNQVANFLSRLGSFCEETLHRLIIKLGGLKYFDKRNHPNDWYLERGRVEPTLWNYFAQREYNIRNRPTYRLTNRFSKWNFVDALIQFRSHPQEIAHWRALSDSLNKLDYWIEKRNDLIHSAIGVSKQSMSVLLQNDRANGDGYALDACTRDQIIAEITNISCKTSELLKQPATPFVGVDAPYYIYSDIRKWVADKLMSDGLR